MQYLWAEAAHLSCMVLLVGLSPRLPTSRVSPDHHDPLGGCTQEPVLKVPSFYARVVTLDTYSLRDQERNLSN